MNLTKDFSLVVKRTRLAWAVLPDLGYVEGVGWVYQIFEREMIRQILEEKTVLKNS